MWIRYTLLKVCVFHFRMKLALSNFRCHRSAVFDIPDKGLVLLSGESGKGKTTVLNALIFVLFGTVRKPYSHGENTCKVELEWGSLKITRTKKPNRLVVEKEGETYEDEAAQSVVDNFLGVDSSQFISSSFIVQSSRNSVVSIPPSAQLDFVQKIALSGNQHLEVRKQIKERVKSYEQQIHQSQGRVSLLEDNIKTLENDLEKFGGAYDHLPNESWQDLKEAKKRVIEKYQEEKSKLVALRHKKKEAQEIEKKYAQAEKEIRIADAEINLLEEKVSKIPKVKEEKIDELVQYLETLIPQLETAKSMRERNRISKDLESQQDEIKKLEKKLKVLKKKIPPESSHIFAQAEQKFIAKQKEKITQELKKIQDVITSVFGDEVDILELENYLSQKEESLKQEEFQLRSDITYDCPSCNAVVKVDGDDLVVQESSNQDNESKKQILFSIQVQLNMVNNWKLTVSHLYEILESKGEYSITDVSKIKHSEKKRKKLLKDKIRLERDIEVKQEINDQLKGDLAVIDSQLKGTDKPESSVEEIEQEIQNVKQEILDLRNTKSERETLLRKLKTKKRNADTLERRIQGKDTSLEEIEDSISQLEDSISQLSEEKDTIQDKLNAYQLQEKVVSLKDNLDNTKDNLEKENIEQQKIIKRLKGMSTLFTLSKEAEVESIENTISTMNQLAKSYLEDLFDSPISVRLQKAENTRGLCTMIEYNGSVYQTVDELSGGERQRVELAFLLAVNEMTKSNFVFLDESLNNLDAEFNCKTLSSLKEIASNKLVLVVSHEAVTGIFDEVIEIR